VASGRADRGPLRLHLPAVCGRAGESLHDRNLPAPVTL
jgi:hypothetical protein